MSSDFSHISVSPMQHQQHQQQLGMTESDRKTWDYVNFKEEDPRRTASLTVASICTADETDSKELEIHRCLTANGVGTNQEVDLIHLRKLAESPGGLKTMALRRLAWPKLVAAHQVLWDGPPTATVEQPLAANSREIHRLVQRTKWSKYQITKSPKTFDELLGLVLKNDVLPLPTPRPSFADLSEGGIDSVNANSTTTPPHRIRRVSFDLDIPLDDVEEPSHRQLVQMAKDERQLLRKLLSHIYRCHPDAPLFDGLQNLIAVLWIVIESPSLTSITSLQLIQYQWHPQSPTHFMKLLSIWDPVLHEHFCLQENSHAPPHCIANSWIPHWFSNDLKDLDILLRIWDILIVNSPITIIYFSVALVVHFRDSLLRANQQPIFQAILHHLPSDGLEKYDMVEPILQRCLQALHDYPSDLIIDSASLPHIPEWVLHSTAPTDNQVIQRLADLRQVMVSEPNPAVPTFDNILQQSLPCMRSSTTDVTLTPTDDECGPWQETPDTTPCSTPESVRSVRTMFHAMETPKLPKPEILSMNWCYKIVTVCWVSMVFVAAAYSRFTRSTYENITITTQDEDDAPPNVAADKFPSEKKDHSIATLPVVAPVPCPYDESRATSTPNYVNLARPDNFQIAAADVPPGRAQSLNPISALDTDLIALLQDYGGNICHPIHEFNSHPQSEDLYFWDSSVYSQPHVAYSEESTATWLVESMTESSTTVTTVPFQKPESRAHGEEMPQLGTVPNTTRFGFALAHVAFDHVDSSHAEPSAVPRQSYDTLQPKVKPTRSGWWSNPKHFVLGIGNFLMTSTEAHLRGRREAHTLLVTNVQRFVNNQANGKNPILDIHVSGEERDSKNSKQKNKIQNIVKVVQENGKAAVSMALEATAIRLDASRSARTKASQLVATVSRRSQVMTEDSVARVYGHLLATTNVTRNSVGMTTRAIVRTSNRFARQMSSVATHKGSKILRSLHDGLQSKYGSIGQGIRSRIPLLKRDVRNVVKEYEPSNQTVTESLAAAILHHSGTVFHLVVSLLSHGGTVILQEFARLRDQLAQSLPQLRASLSSGIQDMKNKGISMALLVALEINECVSKIHQIRVFQDWPPPVSISVNVSKRPPRRHHLDLSLVEVQPVEVLSWGKVRPTLRRSRGAADVAREALMKKTNRNISIDQPLGLDEDFRMEAFSPGSQPRLPEIQQRLHEIGDRTKNVLARVAAVVSKSSSHFFDNLALRLQYLQSILGMFLKYHSDRMGMVRGTYLNLTLREVELSALLLSYNLFFVMIALIEVGKKEIQHSSERQITAVRHVYKESWRGIEKAAALRKENISILHEKIAGTIAKAKDVLSRTRPFEW